MGTIFADISGVMQEGMLARFAMALQRGQIEVVGGQGIGGQGGNIVVDDNCLVWTLFSPDLIATWLLLTINGGTAHVTSISISRPTDDVSALMEQRMRFSHQQQWRRIPEHIQSSDVPCFIKDQRHGHPLTAILIHTLSAPPKHDKQRPSPLGPG